MLDYIANIIQEKERATMLSIESQFRTLFIVIVAPIIGYIADIWGVKLMFYIIGLSMSILTPLIKLLNISKNKQV
jgi:MFS-type transporter involved in bile tolerance (Atg22 family)